MSSDCTVDMSDGELCCDNVPRFHGPRLKDDGETLEVTCMTQAHEITISELPDDTLETVTRRLFERGRDHRDEEREVLLSAVRNRGLFTPENPSETSWFVIELTEQETRDLETGGYPEAYQMSRSIAETDTDSMWETPGDDSLRVMKLSQWALRRVPDEIGDRSVPVDDSSYAADSF